MPRRAMLDAEKPIYHGIMPGIEKRPIFGDDLVWERFLSRMGQLALETGTGAWDSLRGDWPAPGVSISAISPICRRQQAA